MSKPYRIVGSEIAFSLDVPAKKLKEACADIWNNPQNYSKYPQGSEDAFYRFLKYLWIEKPNGEVSRLVDFVRKDIKLS